jgi:hypothetical protein
MSSAPTTPVSAQRIRGSIIEAEIKTSVSPAFPLPLVSGLYAIEAGDGIWLCAYYGSNRSVFDYLPQKGADFDEKTAGITFHSRQRIPKDEYRPELWEQFKKSRLMTFKAE